MSEPKPFASLSPSLLARKGGAKPAMRPQLQPLHQFHENVAHDMHSDLGWNDMGEDTPPALTPPAPLAMIREDMPQPEAQAAAPEIVRQQEHLAEQIAEPMDEREPWTPAPVIRPRGAKAAFTLRLDPERHLRLRLACAVNNRSAQQIVTQALDAFLNSQPELEALAQQVPGTDVADSNR